MLTKALLALLLTASAFGSTHASGYKLSHLTLPPDALPKGTPHAIEYKAITDPARIKKILEVCSNQSDQFHGPYFRENNLMEPWKKGCKHGTVCLAQTTFNACISCFEPKCEKTASKAPAQMRDEHEYACSDAARVVCKHHNMPKFTQLL